MLPANPPGVPVVAPGFDGLVDPISENGQLVPSRDPPFRRSGLWTAHLGSLIRDPRLALNRLVDLAAMHGDVLGSLDADSHLVPADLNDGHRDIVVDDDALVFLAGENQHCLSSLVPIALGA